MKELTFPDSSNDEIVQTAQKNDMSVEFVRWFFNEKKAACGEQWFLALGAMWEGWKAREGEATALALTLEKSREAAGCPAGVDLQDWVKHLAAESLTMLRLLTDISENHVEYFSEGEDGMFAGVPLDYVSEINMYVSRDVNAENPFPATDRILAEAEARGLEKGIAHLDNKFSNIGVQIMNLQWLADSLREGADK
ncbi:hypothetical protein R5M13_004679 [Klebsiella aerogenes]|nr:hypothetical protein [Klebsiella aerogenes]ELS4541263.1 hypothetical protein [Klebsiella aerogenes]